jgi:hypothetical protein
VGGWGGVGGGDNLIKSKKLKSYFRTQEVMMAQCRAGHLKAVECANSSIFGMAWKIPCIFNPVLINEND